MKHFPTLALIFNFLHRGWRQILIIASIGLLIFLLIYMFSFLHKCRITVENNSGQDIENIQIFLGSNHETIYQIKLLKNGKTKSFHANFVGECSIHIDYDQNPEDSKIDLNVYIESIMPYKGKIIFQPNNVVTAKVTI